MINPRSGDEEPSPRTLVEEARRRGIAAHVLGPDEDAGEAARATEAEVIGVAGGDGSLAAVAETAIERGLPFVCVPYGTRNHFARDLGLDADDPVAALDAFRGHERAIDAGRADGRLFLNNVSLGLYAKLVHERERHGLRGRAFTSARALLLALRRSPIHFTIDGTRRGSRVILVANNYYRLALFSLGARERLDEGMLYLYEAEGVLPNRWDERPAQKLEIAADAPRLEAAVDGEPVVLETPCEFAIEAGALRVLIPREPR